MRMREDGRRQLLLSHRIQQAVVGLLYLVNDVRCVSLKCEVGCQDLRACSVYSARTGAEIKDVVVEVEFHLKILDHLAVEAVSEEDFRAARLRECSWPPT